MFLSPLLKMSEKYVFTQLYKPQFGLTSSSGHMFLLFIYFVCSMSALPRDTHTKAGERLTDSNVHCSDLICFELEITEFMCGGKIHTYIRCKFAYGCVCVSHNDCWGCWDSNSKHSVSTENHDNDETLQCYRVALAKRAICLIGYTVPSGDERRGDTVIQQDGAG